MQNVHVLYQRLHLFVTGCRHSLMQPRFLTRSSLNSHATHHIDTEGVLKLGWYFGELELGNDPWGTWITVDL